MHPILFSIGSFYIGTYGVMLALGLIAGTTVALWRARALGLPTDRLMDIVFFTILAGIVGGRVTYILISLDEFARDPMALILSREGFVFLGGVIFGVATALWLIRRYELPVWQVADVFIAGLPLGHAFGRVGCFLAGCCYGRVIPEGASWSFLGVRFPAISVSGEASYPGQAFHEHVAMHGLSPQATCSLPVYPTQLFEVFGNLLIFAALMWLWRRRRFRGQVFVAYLALYGVLRFCIEFLRGDPRGAVGPLSTSQAISLAMVVCAAVGWKVLSRTQDLSRVVAEEAREARVEKRQEKRRNRRGRKRDG